MTCSELISHFITQQRYANWLDYSFGDEWHTPMLHLMELRLVTRFEGAQPHLDRFARTGIIRRGTFDALKWNSRQFGTAHRYKCNPEGKTMGFHLEDYPRLIQPHVADVPLEQAIADEDSEAA